MFTGIVQALGTIDDIVEKSNDARIAISTPESFLADTEIGDSICVQGVCLTVVAIESNVFSVDVIP